jgi:hypothetical protein
MQIRVNQNVAGAECSFTIGDYTVGEGQLTEALAHEFLTCGIADLIRADPPQVAVLPAPEVATPRGRPPARGRRQRSESDRG